jgi:UDPglucose 6-dehydrogenase
VNQRQRVMVVDKLLRELKILKGRTIGLLGLSFKPQTDDLRDAPAIDLAIRLGQHGCQVRGHDPVAMNRWRQELPHVEIDLVDAPAQLFESADAVILVTDWPEYLSLDWAALRERMRQPVVVDGRSFLDRAELDSAGFRVLAIP